jgi:lipopolysaccharide export system ATP-binding protein
VSAGGRALVAARLRKCYGQRRVVDGVSLHVRAGEVVGLLGPNGAGKSTVFRLLAGVERADAGECWIGEARADGLPLHRRARLGLGYLPQEDTLFRDLTVVQNVALAVEVARSGLQPAALLRRVGLHDMEARRIEGLSGGERHRLSIARLLAIRPRVLLLDEPFAGIDPIAVRGLQELVRGLAAEGAAVLLTDHAVRETLATCDRALLLDGGIVHVEGSPAVVAADPHARARYLGPDFSLA